MTRLPVLGAILLLAAGCASVPARPHPLGAAFAWATFDSDRITDSGASGLADRRTGRALTIDDPVRIASVSKLVAAFGAMRLVEEGKLDLDADVSEQLGWPLRNPHFPDRPISLRLLLSHQSSLTDDIDYAIPLGRTVREALRDPAAFDAAHAPGAYFRYANLNFPVIASVMEKASGERFDRLMARLVLAPLGLDACFNWTTCSNAAAGRAAVLYAADGSVVRDDLQGRLPACPVVAAADGSCDLAGYAVGSNGALFSPQGGLRISARDLATIGRMLLNEGRHGQSRFLNEWSIAELLGQYWRFEGTNGQSEDGFYCSYGLAVQSLPVAGCRDDLFGDGRQAFGHAGEAYGLRSGLWIDRERGRGIAYFATGLGDNPPPGETAYRAIEEELARRLKR